MFVPPVIVTVWSGAVLIIVTAPVDELADKPVLALILVTHDEGLTPDTGPQ